MIPFFSYQVIPIGPLQIQVWGLFVALGIGLAIWIGRRKAITWGLDPSQFLDMAAWTLLFGVIGARLFFVVYDPGPFIQAPWNIVRIWDGGMSMVGGLIGAGLTVWLFCRRAKLSFLEYANAVSYGLPWGYALGRIGCFLIHDHVGVTTNFFLAVDFPGAAKLDMGLIHSLLGLVIGVSFVLADRWAKGRQLPYFFMFLLVYGFSRLVLDFFRYWDPPFAESRYGKLTPAQWLGLPAMALGAWFLISPPRRTAWQKLTGWLGHGFNRLTRRR